MQNSVQWNKEVRLPPSCMLSSGELCLAGIEYLSFSSYIQTSAHQFSPDR